MDGPPDKNTLRHMNHIAYRCANCGRLHQRNTGVCSACDSREFEPTTLRAPEYCNEFGHDYEEEAIPGSERDEEHHGTLRPKNLRIAAVSREFLQSCRRCGHQKKVRRTISPDRGQAARSSRQ